jgi:hypothetical protein
VARIRTIKPEFWFDEKLASLSFGARLLFIGIWNNCDDIGVCRANPYLLKSAVFPYDDVKPKELQGWLDEISGQGLIRIIIFNGESYLHVKNWNRHQKIDKPSKVRIIQGDGLSDSDTLELFSEKFERTPGVVGEDSANTPPRKGREGKGIGREKEGKGKQKNKNPELHWLARLWNRKIVSLPKVTKLNDSRKEKIRLRLEETPSPRHWIRIIRAVEASDFLSGRNGRWTHCSFDWLLTNDSNHVKVLEGNYDNKASTPQKPPPGPQEDFNYDALEKQYHEAAEEIS